MRFFLPIIAFFTALALGQNSQSNNNYLGTTPSQRFIINAAQAQQVVAAAAHKAANISSPSDIAVTDPSGFLVAFLRTDNAYLGSIDISIKKAKTVALFNGAFPSAGLYNNSQPGAPLYGIEETNGGLVVFGGGVPIVVNSIFIGAVGVSGGTVQQDIDIAYAGAMAVGGYVPSR